MSRRLTALEKTEFGTALAFTLPFIIGVLLFSIIPIVYSIYISFLNLNSIANFRNQHFIGFDNYLRLFQDETAMASFVKSLQFTLFYVPAILVVSLAMAMLMNQAFYLRKLTRSLILMPYVSNVVAIAIVWSVLLNPYDGVVNTLLLSLGLQDLPMWLGDIHMALPISALIFVWMNLAFQTIVYLAALQEVPQELYEAAQIDGATTWQKFSRITLPSISPTTFFLMVSTIIGSTQNFAIIKNLTNGGPGNSSEVVAMNIYNSAFLFNTYSLASAESVLLFLILLAITIVQWKVQKKWVAN